MAVVTTLIPCRDGAATLPQTLRSLQQQTLPTTIVVADDASIDATPSIIRAYGVSSVTYPRREPRNYNRVPVLINMAYRDARPAAFYLISGDDNVYPPDYLEKLTGWMRRDHVAIASGYNDTYRTTKAPCGGGRVMTATLMQHLMPLPRHLGWDTWMLYRANRLGYAERVYPIQKHPIGPARSTIYTFGHAAHLLGSPLLFTVLRVVLELARGHPLRRSLSILVGHMEYHLRGIPQTADPQFYMARLRRLHGLIRALARNVIRL